MMEAPDLAAQDPGRGWRRLARVGAGLLVAAILIPIIHGYAYYISYIEQSIRADPAHRLLSSAQKILFCIFACLLVSFLAIGPLFLAACRRKALKSGMNRILLSSLILAGLLTTTVFAYFNLLRLGSISIPSLLLFIVGLSVLSYWHSRKSVFCIFWPALLLIFMAAMSWGALFALILSTFIDSHTAHLAIWFSIIVTMGFSGSTLLLTGWLMWWRAIRRALRAQETAAEQGGGQAGL